jgi:hypothetical protein
MIGGGAYLLTAFDILDMRRKVTAVPGAAGVFLMLLGGYLLWVDIIAPAIGTIRFFEAPMKRVLEIIGHGRWWSASCWASHTARNYQNIGLNKPR